MRLQACTAALCLALLTACSKLLSGEETDYAKGFSDFKLKQITNQMTEQSVLAILSHPLDVTTQQWSEVWTYWPKGSSPQAVHTATGSVFNLFGAVTHLRFTPAGLVSSTSGDFLKGDFVGQTKQQIISRVGEPAEREVRKFEIILHYSRPATSGAGTYKKREIHLDENRRVRSVVTNTFYD
jgi:hypothetical protein